jgi:outer membrane lipoprotein-sorting protein
MTAAPSMKWIVLTFACGALAAESAAQTLTGQQLAEQLDRVRRPTRSFEVHMELTELRDGKPVRVVAQHVYARKNAGRPEYDTVSISLAPEEDRNKVILTKDRGVWLLDPKATRPVAISPQKFRSKFFVADALTTSFAAQYDSEIVGEEKVLDAARKERNCHHLRMKLKDKEGMTPETIDYWMEKGTLRVVRGQFFNGKGKLLRTAYYTSFQQVLGETRPMRILIVSEVEAGLVTDIQFTKLAHRDTPPGLYAPEAMSAVSRGELP